MIVTGIQLLFANPENQMEIWSVILFLSSQKFHTEQFFVLSSSILGPGQVQSGPIPRSTKSETAQSSLALFPQQIALQQLLFYQEANKWLNQISCTGSDNFSPDFVFFAVNLSLLSPPLDNANQLNLPSCDPLFPER